MTDSTPDPTVPASAPPVPAEPPLPPAYAQTPPAPPAYASAPPPAPVAYATPGAGQLGKVRGTGACMGLFVVTLGIYGLVWAYSVHEEMKRYSGQGLGGAVGLVLWWFVSVVSAFLIPGEIANLYRGKGKEPPVAPITGLWATLGALILVGPIVWFVKVNGALNEFWKSQGATA